MRFRILRREKARPAARPPRRNRLPRLFRPVAAELENPYGRYYGTARSREDLKR